MSASISETAHSTPVSTPQGAQRKPFRGDRGNAYKIEKQIGGRTAKEMGLKKRKKQRDEYYTFCDHKNPKTGKRQCDLKRDKIPFTGWNTSVVMRNKALHEIWHLDQDKKREEW